MSMFSIPIDETGEATRIVRTGMVIVLVFLGGFFVWGALSPIRTAVIAEGIIKIDTKRKTIQHFDGGIIKEILVREGQFVEQGQVLLVLGDADKRSALTILQDQLSAALAKEARLLAEKDFSSSVSFPTELARSKDDKVRHLLQNEDALFLTKKKSLDEQVAILRTEIGHAKQQLENLQAQITVANENIHFKEQRVAAAEALSTRQYIGKTQLLELKEGLAEKQEQRNQLMANLSALRQNQAELELRIISLRNEYAKLADDELKETKKAIYELQEKIPPAQLALARSRVVAPISGQVIDLKVSTVGGVVIPGSPLMDLVPRERELIVEVKIQTQDIDLVHIGQRADVQLLAYNNKSMPHVEGEVVYVSGDALQNQQDPSQYYYLAHVRIAPEALEDFPDVHLAPGMPASAYIQTKPKTFFEILAKPVTDVVSRGLRRDN